jgi:protein-tyrosine phosphatase
MDTFSRMLALDGASNFRDLGGYIGADGRRLRWRRLFRSDHLAALTPQDKQALASLGLARAVDLRGHAERAAMAYELPRVQQLALPIEPTVVQRAKDLAAAGHTLTADVAVRLMQDTYRAFVSDNTAQFAALFARLLDDDSPLVFHCTAGKDRTGFAAALLLLALGVSQRDVMQDYLLTNSLYRRPAGLGGTAPDEALRVIWQVQEDFLQAALQLVAHEYGGMERYLAQRLGVGAAARQRLYQLYLQPAVG